MPVLRRVCVYVCTVYVCVCMCVCVTVCTQYSIVGCAVSAKTVVSMGDTLHSPYKTMHVHSVKWQVCAMQVVAWTQVRIHGGLHTGAHTYRACVCVCVCVCVCQDLGAL